MTEKKKKTDEKAENKNKADIVETPIKQMGEKPIATRGRTFEGKVIRKFPKRITIEFERMIYVKKYERYSRFRTKIHARLPENLEKDINIGDLIQVRECRPLSKILHFLVIKKIKDAEEAK